MRQYKPQEEAKEIQRFSHISKYQLPNSKRTLIPSYQPENNKENMNHKALSYYSNKFNSNSVGPDFISNEPQKIKMQRKSAAQILKESAQPRKIRQLKSNILHKKYVESSQINNIPGPEIMKRYENNRKSAADRRALIPCNRRNNNKNDLYLNKRKNSYMGRNSDIESFQRKVFRDYNSNIACLPGVNLNEKEKMRTLVATNSRKNESHIHFGNDEENKDNSTINFQRNKYDYYKDYTCKSKDIIRSSSFSGKKIVRNKINESHILNNLVCDENCSSIINVRDYNKTSISNKQKYFVNKNKSQIVFG